MDMKSFCLRSKNGLHHDWDLWVVISIIQTLIWRVESPELREEKDSISFWYSWVGNLRTIVSGVLPFDLDLCRRTLSTKFLLLFVQLLYDYSSFPFHVSLGWRSEICHIAFGIFVLRLMNWKKRWPMRTWI